MYPATPHRSEHAPCVVGEQVAPHTAACGLVGLDANESRQRIARGVNLAFGPAHGTCRRIRRQQRRLRAVLGFLDG